MCNYRVIEFWCDKCLLATPQPESTTTPSSSPPNRGSWLGFLGSSPPPENSIPTVAPAEPQYHVIKQYTYQQCPQPKPADPPADQRYCENPVRQNNPHDFEPVVSRIRGMCPVCDAIEKAVKAAEKRAKEEVLVLDPYGNYVDASKATKKHRRVSGDMHHDKPKDHRKKN